MGKSLVIIHPSWRRRGARKRKFGEELVVVAWKTRRLLGGLVSTSLDLPLGGEPTIVGYTFLPKLTLNSKFSRKVSLSNANCSLMVKNLKMK